MESPRSAKYQVSRKRKTPTNPRKAKIAKLLAAAKHATNSLGDATKHLELLDKECADIESERKRLIIELDRLEEQLQEVNRRREFLRQALMREEEKLWKGRAQRG